MDAILAKKTVEPKREVTPTGFFIWYKEKVHSTMYIPQETFDLIVNKLSNHNTL